LNPIAQTEHSGSNPRLLPRWLRSPHASLWRRKIANGRSRVLSWNGQRSESACRAEHVIRSRYLISYQASEFRHDGRYPAITIYAEKSGDELPTTWALRLLLRHQLARQAQSLKPPNLEKVAVVIGAARPAASAHLRKYGRAWSL